MFVSFFHVACNVVLPTLVSVWYWTPPHQPPSGTAAQRRAVHGAAAGGMWARAMLRLHQLQDSVAAAVALIDLGMHSVLARNRLLVSWYLLATTWLWAKGIGGMA